MRPMLLLASLAIAGCGPPPPAPAAAATPGDPVEGLRVATRVGCTGCHGKDGGGKELGESRASSSSIRPT